MAMASINPVEKKKKLSPLEAIATVMEIGSTAANLAGGVKNLAAPKALGQTPFQLSAPAMLQQGAGNVDPLLSKGLVKPLGGKF